MITAVDTNVLIALWDTSDALNVLAQNALDKVYDSGRLIISGAVFAELLGPSGRTEKMIESFLDDTGITVEWKMDEATWRTAARADQGYVKRRRRQKLSEPRRIITDFLIGAQAEVNNYRLLTLDKRIYKAAFPRLNIIEM
jgi:predicted nucleic acid-binding protein